MEWERIMKKKARSSKKSSGKSALIDKIKVYLMKPVTWVVMLAVGSLGAVIVTGVFNPYFAAVIDKITRPSPVTVSNIRVHQHGGTFMALPPEVQLSAADAAKITPSDESPLLAKGGVRVGDENIQLAVTGNRTSGVRIMGITPVKQCQSPLAGAYFESHPAGGDASLTVYMNVDDPRPQAMDKHVFVLGKRTADAVPYFDANTVSLKKDEQIVFVVNVTAQESYYTFEFDMLVLEDGAEHTQRINLDGRPFSITPQLGRSAWEGGAYLGGVECKQNSGGHYVPASADWVTGGAGC